MIHYTNLLIRYEMMVTPGKRQQIRVRLQHVTAFGKYLFVLICLNYYLSAHRFLMQLGNIRQTHGKNTNTDT